MLFPPCTILSRQQKEVQRNVEHNRDKWRITDEITGCQNVLTSHSFLMDRQQAEGRLVKICGQDEVQEGQEEEDEDDGAGVDDEDHVNPGYSVQRG